MATQKSVITLLKKQGAEFEWENPNTFSAWLPDGKIWNSGYGVGQVVDEVDFFDSKSKFWESIMMVIDAEVVDD